MKKQLSASPSAPSSAVRKRNIRRRILLSVPAVLLAVLTGWIIWGNRTLEVTRLTVRVKDLPHNFQGMKIAHVSDLHGRSFGEGQEKLLSAIASAEPDLIAVTGDIINADEDDLETTKAFLDGALQIAPVYYVIGNHEPDSPALEELLAYMEEVGVILLLDRAQVLTRDGETLTLMGLSDPYLIRRNDPDVDLTLNLQEKLAELSSETDGCRILLSHRPEFLEIYAEKAELVLSGHAHGGQIRIPFVGGLYAPGQGIFPEYTEGIHQMGNTRMVVSRGLGGPEPRINNRPQLLLLTLTADDQAETT